VGLRRSVVTLERGSVPRWAAVVGAGAGRSVVAGNGPLRPVYPRPLIPVNGLVVVVYSRSAGNGGRTSCTPSGRRPAPVRSCGRGPADSAWTVSKVIFSGSPVTFVAVGVCE
jgi:hypothetical protein